MRRWFYELTIFGTILTSLNAYAVSEECAAFFQNNNIYPGADCELSCATLPTSMATFGCPAQCREYCRSRTLATEPSKSNEPLDSLPMDEEERRQRLKEFAIEEFKSENRCNALANIVDEASRLIGSEENPSKTMLEDLKEVLIGEGLHEGRGKGPYFAGNVYGALVTS